MLFSFSFAEQRGDLSELAPWVTSQFKCFPRKSAVLAAWCRRGLHAASRLSGRPRLQLPWLAGLSFWRAGLLTVSPRHLVVY